MFKVSNIGAWYTSSSDPAKLSMFITGAITALIPIIIAFGQMNGIDITETKILDFVKQLTAWLSALWLLWGGLRKVYHWFFR